MEVGREQILNFIKGLHLFCGIDEDHINRIVDRLEVIEVGEGVDVFHENELGSNFFIIFEGKVKATRVWDQREHILGHLVRGDYFGEESLLYRKRHSATITAVAPTVLLSLKAELFLQLIAQIPSLKSNLMVAISSHHLSRRVRFDWLGKDEDVYFISRRHPYFLWIALLGPIFFGLIAILISLGIYVFLPLSVTAVVVAVLLLAGILMWGLWAYNDWHNDYFIVTNQRVVWQERVLGLYDSRTEAPLGTVLSVSIQTDQIGRILGYGNVIVRTFTGPITLDRISYPEQVASLIEEHWFRTKSVSRAAEEKVMEKAILTRIYPDKTPKEAPKPAAPPAPRPKQGYSTLFRLWLTNMFQTKIEYDNVVTYRKHWFILLVKTWKPVLGMILVGAAIYARLQNAYTFISVYAVFALALMFGLLFLGWYAYNYVDWRNDIYQITPEQIIDIERKPFGTENKRSAPLENILSIEHERTGFLGFLLNFGTVYITVGGSKLHFQNIHNPSDVQSDIFRYLTTRLNKKKEMDSAGERQRMVEWIAAYHRSMDAANRVENKKPE